MIQRIQPQDTLAYRAIDIGHCTHHAFAMVATGAVTQLQGFAAPGGGTGRHTGHSHCTATERDHRFDGRVTPRVKDFPCVNMLDQGWVVHLSQHH
ncbi:hypothetical protein D3C81_1693070 [compost metagenome]